MRGQQETKITTNFIGVTFLVLPRISKKQNSNTSPFHYNIWNISMDTSSESDEGTCIIRHHKRRSPEQTNHRKDTRQSNSFLI